MTDFPEFSEFFTAVTARNDHSENERPGRAPYKWQKALSDEVARTGKWPDAIPIPTGLGKSSCIHIAVYELARQLHAGGPRTAPLRIFHVIDRNSVVQQSAGDVADLVREVNESDDARITPVRDALRKAIPRGRDSEPAISHAHHRGVLRVGDDIRAFGCVITVMTAHQYVSQLLFRGYGVSAKTRSIYAGLAGIDSLVLFDEPHLSAPALTTISDVQRLQGSRGDLQVPGLDLVRLGATQPPQSPGDDESTPQPWDYPVHDDTDVKKRIDAARPFTLSTVSGKSDKAFIDRIVSLVVAEYTSENRRIGVIVNTVAVAAAVAARLEAHKKTPIPVVVETSRIRPLDRIRSRNEQNDPDKQSEAAGAESVVVATQCIEVGVDISFDVLITEACPLPSLVQRIGRLNRAGESNSRARGYLVTAAKGDATQVRDGSAAVYGEDPIRWTVEYLDGLAVDSEFDASLRAQADWEIADPKFWPSGERHATLTGATIPYLTQTFPPPAADIPVDAYISGPDAEDRAEVLVAWRAELSLLDDCPPSDGEYASLPIGTVRRFLNGHRDLPAGLSDEIAVGDAGTEQPATYRPSYRVRVAGGDWSDRKRLTPGCQVVIDAAEGGHSSFGWDPPSRATVSDLSAVAGLIQAGAGRSVEFPLSRTTLAPLLPGDELGEFDEMLSDADLLDDDVLTGIRDFVNGCLPGRLPLYLPNGRTDSLSGTAPNPPVTKKIESVVAGDDGTLRAVIPAPGRIRNLSQQRLDAHLRQVGFFAGESARAAGLADDLVTKVTAAGLWHDCGKNTRAWQTFATGEPQPGETLSLDDAVAKPTRVIPSGPARRRYADSIGLPVLWRHEALSYHRCLAASGCPLVAHLAACHHGFFRPIAPVPDVERFPLTDEEKKSQLYGADHADAFEDLNEEYGAWGLAYLEAVVRLADWEASAAPADVPASAELKLPVTPPPSRRVTDDSRLEAIELEGLTANPAAGWFAAVGLLGAIKRLGRSGKLYWYDHGAGRPQLPILLSDVPLDVIVQTVWEDDGLAAADGLSQTITESAFSVKHQKIADPKTVRKLLLEADKNSSASFITGLVNDACPSTDSKLALACAAHANNSYFGGVVKRALKHPYDEAVAALLDPMRGYLHENWDGGFDRPPAFQPLVNGLGEHNRRLSRVMIAPLIVEGFAALGTPPPGGHGVANRTLTLPLPTHSTTLAALRAWTYLGDSSLRWHWSAIGCEWVLKGEQEKLTKYESVWNTRIVRRSPPAKK